MPEVYNIPPIQARESMAGSFEFSHEKRKGSEVETWIHVQASGKKRREYDQLKLEPGTFEKSDSSSPWFHTREYSDSKSSDNPVLEELKMCGPTQKLVKSNIYMC